MLGLAGFATGGNAQEVNAVDWSGPYLGGSVSGITGTGSTSASTRDDFAGTYFIPPDADQIAEEVAGSFSRNHVSPGVFGGYGQQVDNYYFGIEASANTLGFEGSRSVDAQYTSGGSNRFAITMSAEADWQATLRSRIGWAQDRWLGYLTGGAAVTRVRMNATYSDDLAPGGSGSASTDQTRIGLAVGAGAEIDLGDGWALRGEYVYSDFGKVSATSRVTNAGFAGANDLTNSVHLRTHAVSFGLSYRF